MLFNKPSKNEPFVIPSVINFLTYIPRVRGKEAISFENLVTEPLGFENIFKTLFEQFSKPCEPNSAIYWPVYVSCLTFCTTSAQPFPTWSICSTFVNQFQLWFLLLSIRKEAIAWVRFYCSRLLKAVMMHMSRIMGSCIVIAGTQVDHLCAKKYTEMHMYTYTIIWHLVTRMVLLRYPLSDIRWRWYVVQWSWLVKQAGEPNPTGFFSDYSHNLLAEGRHLVGMILLFGLSSSIINWGRQPRHKSQKWFVLHTFRSKTCFLSTSGRQR